MEHIWEISVRVLVNIRNIKNIYTHPEKRDQWVSVWPEVLKKMVGMSDHNFTCVVYGPLQKFFDALPKRQYTELLAILEGIKKEFNVSFYKIRSINRYLPAFIILPFSNFTPFLINLLEFATSSASLAIILPAYLACHLACQQGQRLCPLPLSPGNAVFMMVICYFTKMRESTHYAEIF